MCQCVGISSSTDASDDSSIHCLKLGGVAHCAVTTTMKETASLHCEGWDGENPFADVCNSKLEDDEAVIEDKWYVINNLPVLKI